MLPEQKVWFVASAILLIALDVILEVRLYRKRRNRERRTKAR